MIYTAAEIKQADETALRKGMPADVLMERAASALAARLTFSPQSSILVVCGAGNNGGDGWVISRELAQRGHAVTVYAPFGDPKSNEAKRHATYARGFVTVTDEPRDADHVIDALFGVGFHGPVNGTARDVISWIREQQAPVVAIDVPSGVPSDDALAFDGHAVEAEVTFSLHGYKRSAFLKRTAPYYGKVEVVEIGLPHTSTWRVLTASDFDRSLLERDTYSHKNTYGHGRLIGGSRHLIGAPFLAGRAALRTGIGLLDLVIPNEALALASSLPEAMYYGIDELLDKEYAANAIGPGLVDDARLAHSWAAVSRSKAPLIVDAGALTKEHLEASGPLTLTPHPGELARLMDKSVDEIEADRFRIASEFAQAHGVHLILKGTYTLIVKPDGTGAVNTVEASALAKGGSGDVLTGILLALWARTDRIRADKSPNEQAVLWHALAAKEASEQIHPASVLATDIIEAIGRI
ncbi:NAD(P)H-hydrate dehydratase [Exiguobacterium aurantiacum]|uniref:Bifunctional NAD(P)H-hydrate repair enzyme n=1 Tax=Exiguobacterium aurantiacum TaxID=33987 RepID=A0ABY5FRB9_9BACL|nr:NAD(P)H-hydrate dehydratase [Exiguobacterium aurantiacum]UTT44106.1 NAD(P)H-hydrate dehydratase [Exiguobacterium aurantiacum]